MTRIWPDIPSAVAHSAHRAEAPLRWDPTGHLLSRFAFGPTESARAYVDRHGPAGWYRTQVDLGGRHPGYQASARVAKYASLLHMTPYDLRQWLAARGNEYGWDAMDQLTEVTLALQAWSPAQLYETLVDFFANHLNVPNHNGDVWTTRHDFDRLVVRRHAFGSFTDMLLASARHPAMLTYLNLAESTKAAVNENYGREVLEMHTVGLRYSESDVKNTARMLTGRTIDQYQHYVFDDYIHPVGRVKVLGFSHPNASARGGQAAGDALLRYLAGHRFTATHLARKLCVRFVSDHPSDTLVAAVAKAYLDNHTRILPMVHTILCSDEFWQSRGAKVRRPAENVVATIRALGITATDLHKALPTLHWGTSSMGAAPLDWPAPNGYPDVAQSWRSAGNLLQEWDFHLGLAGGWWDGLSKPSTATLYGTTPADSGQAISLLTRRLTGMTFSAAHRQALQDFLAEPADTPMAQSSLRWLAEPLTALILDAPHHALR